MYEIRIILRRSRRYLMHVWTILTMFANLLKSHDVRNCSETVKKRRGGRTSLQYTCISMAERVLSDDYMYLRT